MGAWRVTCPDCGTEHDVQVSEMQVQCGSVSCQCTCNNCGCEVRDEQAYWRWLGLDDGPPAEREASSGA